MIKTSYGCKSSCQRYIYPLLLSAITCQILFLTQNLYSAPKALSMNSIPKISLVELRSTEKMSRRAFNACKTSQLFYLEDIVSHYQAHKDFTSIQNTGVKTNTELIDICEKYIDSYASIQ